MVRVLVCIVLLFVLVCVFPRDMLFAQGYDFNAVRDDQVPEALLKTVPIRLLPSNPLHFLISAKETIERIFKPSAARRAEMDFILCGKRLREAYLLAESGDLQNSKSALDAYGVRSTKMVEQIAKAKGQNQDVTTLAAPIVDALSAHEVLLSALNKKIKGSEFDQAFSGFAKMVNAVDQIKPGVADRFTSIKPVATSTPEPSPGPPTLESSPSVRPRRIIY